MNYYSLKPFIVSCILLYGQILVPTIFSGTLIKTSRGLIPVENITIGTSDVLGCNNEESVEVCITDISTSIAHSAIVITTNNGDMIAAPEQFFYDPVMDRWIQAKDITINTILLNSSFIHCSCLNVQTVSIQPITVYRITTTAPHTFFIYDQEILTHNFVPIFVGLAWLFGGGIEFVGVTVGAAILGTAVGVHIHKKQVNSDAARFTVSPQMGGMCSGYNPDPDDDENKERKFNTISKSEFFKKVEKDYKYRQDGIYQKKRGSKGVENAEYIQWDNLHKDVEAYSRDRWHIGSIDPKTLKLYKPAVVTRRLAKL